MVKTSVILAGVGLRNPIIPASGTFGFGTEMEGAYDLDCLGAIALKGTTAEPRYGNECPRIAECPGGLINSVGLQNPGIDLVLEQRIPALRRIYHGPVIANISGFSIEEYVHCCSKAALCPDIDIIEVNISCPNVHGGGMAFGTSADAAAEVTAAVKAVSGDKPVFIKLSPNVSDIVAIARACEDAGADGLTLINTILGMRIDIKTGKPVVAAGYGGYSGTGIFPIALRMVNQVSKACRIPIMGCGGVSGTEDVIEMMMAGATAVQIGSQNLREPLCCQRMVSELPGLMEKLGIKDLNDIIGKVR